MPRAAWRVGVGEVMQESNSFCPSPTTADCFVGTTAADEVLAREALGENSEMAGFLDVLGTTSAVELVPLLRLGALAGGPLTSSAHRWLRDDLHGALARAGRLDAVLLALHGALIAVDEDDVDGALLAACRERLGPTAVVAATLDLHALVTARMAEAANVLVAYRTYPHVDQRCTGQRAAELVLRALESGVRPRVDVATRPFLVAPDSSGTDDGPLAFWMERARALEKEPGVWAASCCPVQPWLDVPSLGSTTVVVTERGALGASRSSGRAEALADLGWSLRASFKSGGIKPSAAVAGALHAAEGPVVVADLGDGTAGGGFGDIPVLVSELVGQSVGKPCVVPLVDDVAVKTCWQAGIGAELEVVIGARRSVRWAQGLPVRGRVTRLLEGSFVLEGPYFRGRAVELGRGAVLHIGPVAVLLLGKPVLTSDPGLYRMAGLPPEAAHVVVVKSPRLFRAAFQPFAKKIFLATTPGPTDVRWERLPWRRLGRPIYPLDDL